MSSTQGALAATPTPIGRLRARTFALGRTHLEPIALALLAATLGLWGLGRNGWANTYYSAAVRSMSSNWHDFLYASFDPSGIMSVDKPPLALWVQALSVRVFGFHPLAILVPQALMGVASVLLVYDLTRGRFGRPAGFVAGLVLALTPIAVAVSRHNNPDALLVLCSVAALWCALRALESRRLRWFVLAGICVGLGFETKMLVALVVLPGIAAAWLWSRDASAGSSPDAHSGARGHAEDELVSGPRRARTRARARRGLESMWHGPLAGAASMLLVAAAWPALVELTPAANRPWVSGTADNRIVSLIFGYNGLGRVEGQGGGPQALGGSNLFGGTPGPLRLLNEALGGQDGWLLGFALLAGVAILAGCRLRRSDPRTPWLLAVGGAFLTTGVLFSFARGIFHPYYVSLLAPFAAALVGAGFGQLSARRPHTDTSPPSTATAGARHDVDTGHRLAATLRGGGAAGVIAALALAASVATELVVLHDYPRELRWLTPALIALGVPALAILLVGGARLRAPVLAAALALLLVAPAAWSVETLGHPTSGTFPAGGPAGNAAAAPGAPPHPFGLAAAAAGGGFGSREGLAAAAARGRVAVNPGAAGENGRRPAEGGSGPPAGGPFGSASQSLARAVRYAGSHGGGTVAVSSQSEAATLVIDGARVAGIGGFSGRESETTAAWLAGEVRAGRIRWVLAGSASAGGLMGGPGSAASATPPAGGLFGVAPGTAPPNGAAEQGAGAPPTGFARAPFSPPAGRTGARDTRVGASRALSAAATSCVRVAAVEGLYDCAGRAAALAHATSQRSRAVTP